MRLRTMRSSGALCFHRIRPVAPVIGPGILRKPQRLSIRKMLEQSEPQQTKFTPMSFLNYQSKSFRRLTGATGRNDLD